MAKGDVEVTINNAHSGHFGGFALPVDIMVGETLEQYNARKCGLAIAEAGSGGMKFDGGKPRFSLLRFGCARALLGIAKVLTFGARKYAAHSWREVPEGIDRYWSSYERHMNRIAIYGLDSRDLNENGEVDEHHSGELDIDHANTNGLFIAELIRKQYGIKD